MRDFFYRLAKHTVNTARSLLGLLRQFFTGTSNVFREWGGPVSVVIAIGFVIGKLSQGSNFPSRPLASASTGMNLLWVGLTGVSRVRSNARLRRFGVSNAYRILTGYNARC
jgi:hypothetical protein